ncbi:MAG TPA: NAD(P)-dependent oxidoreductase [Burkholderiales bacterium]|nr:NAD(P)-dependent oxidoreductase [Burkholderiales bacterium]
MSTARVIVVENDPFPRLLRAFLAAADEPGETAAIAEFLAHDVPDYAAWLAQARARAAGLHPAEVRLAATREELHAALPDADAVVVESLPVGAQELSLAPRLRVVQKYGTVLRNIDTAACAQRQIPVLTLRRRANIACAEHAWALLLALERKLCTIDGLVSMEALRAAGYAPGMFDARYTPNSNWARIGGLRTVYGRTAGIIGLGEIGREVALRAAAFGMDIVYHQRTALAADEAAPWQARYCDLSELLATSDVVFVTVPSNPSTRGLIGAAELARMKAGATLINVSRAAIVDRAALLGALRSGHLGALGLDAFYDEPARPDDPLLGWKNAIVTPRVAAQPRLNALADLSDVMANLATALRK